MNDDTQPSDGWTPALQALRAATTTSTTSAFEQRWQADQQRVLEETREYLDDHPPSEPRFTTAELAEFTPPDPWKADLDKRSSEPR